MSDYIVNGREIATNRPGFVADFRARHALTQEGLGRIVGRGRAAIGGWENGAPVDLAAQRLLQSIDGNPALVRHLANSAPQKASDPAAQFAEFIGNAPCGVDAHPVGPATEGKYWTTQRVARLEVPLRLLRTMAVNSGDVFNEQGERIGTTGSYLVGDGTTRSPLLAPALGGRLSRLGVVYEPMARPLLDQLTPVTLGLPAAEWLGEGDPVSETTPAIERARAAVRFAGCGVSYSRHLATQSNGRAERLVAAMILQSLARAVDGAVLAGEGGLQPPGLLSTVPATGVAGLDAAAVLAAIETLEGQDVDSERLALVAAPSVKKAWGVIVHDGRSLWHTDAGRQYVAGLPALASDLMPANEFLIGDWSTITVHHSENAELVQRAVGADDRRETYAFLAAALSVPRPSAFQRIFLNA